MAYKLMKSLISGGKKSKEWLTNRANVFYAVGQLNDTEYTEIMNLIDSQTNEN